MEQVLAVVERADRTDAALALLGDKRFLFSPEGDAFVMYQVRGTNWIAMGTPSARVPPGRTCCGSCAPWRTPRKGG